MEEPRTLCEQWRKNLNDFDAFPVELVKRLTAENALLETVVNTFLQDDRTPEGLISDAVEALGSDAFTKCLDNGKYLWRQD